jgi:plastocyanin
MRRIGLLVAVFGLAGATIAPTALPAAASPRTAHVKMKDFMFMPASLTVSAGTKVTWTYDEVPTDLQGCENPALQTPLPVNCPGHSVTALEKGRNGKPLFNSGVHRASGFPWSRTFTKPGTYRYYCIPHGNGASPITHMDAVITVTKK